MVVDRESVRRIGILHLIYSLQVGGAENIVKMYAKYYNRLTYRLETCIFRPGGKIVDEVKNHKVKVHCLHSSSSSPKSFIKLLKLFRAKQIHIIHFHNPLPVFWGLPAAKIAKIPVLVLTEHSISYKGRLKMASPIYGYLQKKMDVVFACSEEVKNSHSRKLPQNQLVTIHNGVDTERFFPGPENNEFREKLNIPEICFIIGHVGNLTPQKGQVFLLQSIQRLTAEKIPVVLILAGDGPLKELLESRAKELGIYQNVRFLGQRSDIPEILRSIDVFAGSSLREGFPISVLEAMATGIPVVTTNVGGNKEAVLDGITGFIVSPGNPDELALALKKILLNDNLRRNMGTAARRRVEEYFSAKTMVKRTEEIYETLLRKKNLLG